MHLAYLDESHDKSEYWITGLIVPALRAQKLEFTLDDIVLEAENSYPQINKGNGKPVELHGHALAQGTEDWEPMAQILRARLGVYEKALSAIAAIDGVAVVRTGVDRQRLVNRYGDRAEHPHDLTLTFALERIHLLVKARNGMVLVTCDQTDHPDRHHANLRVFRKVSTGGLIPRKLTTIVDTIHFADSRHSRLVQAADLVSYIWFRHRTDVLYQITGRATEAAERLWKTIDLLPSKSYLWKP